MKSKSLLKPKLFLIVCCAALALAFLIGVVGDGYAARGGGGGAGRGGAGAGGGFDRGGPASDGSFDAATPGVGRAGVGGQAGVGGGPAGVGRAGVGGPAGVGGGPVGPVGVGAADVDEARVGAAAAATAYPAANRAVITSVTAVPVLPCSSATIYVGGVAYYNCGSTYYTQAYADGSVMYVPTAPPGN
jgi:hypothetical protein